MKIETDNITLDLNTTPDAYLAGEVVSRAPGGGPALPDYVNATELKLNSAFPRVQGSPEYNTCVGMAFHDDYAYSLLNIHWSEYVVDGDGVQIPNVSATQDVYVLITDATNGDAVSNFRISGLGTNIAHGIWVDVVNAKLYLIITLEVLTNAEPIDIFGVSFTGGIATKTTIAFISANLATPASPTLIGLSTNAHIPKAVSGLIHFYPPNYIDKFPVKMFSLEGHFTADTDTVITGTDGTSVSAVASRKLAFSVFMAFDYAAGTVSQTAPPDIVSYSYVDPSGASPTLRSAMYYHVDTSTIKCTYVIGLMCPNSTVCIIPGDGAFSTDVDYGIYFMLARGTITENESISSGNNSNPLYITGDCRAHSYQDGSGDPVRTLMVISARTDNPTFLTFDLLSRNLNANTSFAFFLCLEDNSSQTEDLFQANTTAPFHDMFLLGTKLVKPFDIDNIIVTWSNYDDPMGDPLGKNFYRFNANGKNYSVITTISLNYNMLTNTLLWENVFNNCIQFLPKLAPGQAGLFHTETNIAVANEKYLLMPMSAYNPILMINSSSQGMEKKVGSDATSMVAVVTIADGTVNAFYTGYSQDQQTTTSFFIGFPMVQPSSVITNPSFYVYTPAMQTASGYFAGSSYVDYPVGYSKAYIFSQINVPDLPQGEAIIQGIAAAPTSGGITPTTTAGVVDMSGTIVLTPNTVYYRSGQTLSTVVSGTPVGVALTSSLLFLKS
jgi:hypothetical protein